MGILSSIKFEAIAVIGCAFFLLVFRYISPWLSAKTCPGLKSAPYAKQIEWHTRVNSCIHAIVVSCMCVYAFCYEDELQEDPITCDNPVVRSSSAVLVGYMAADTMLMIIYSKEIWVHSYVFHHAISIFAYYQTMVYGIFPYYANYKLMAEFSTTSLNVRWFMNTLKVDRSSPWYMGNDFLLALVFFACRIASVPFYWYKIYCVWGTKKFTDQGYLPYCMILFCFGLDVMNLLWFRKLCKGLKKMLPKKQK